MKVVIYLFILFAIQTVWADTEQLTASTSGPTIDYIDITRFQTVKIPLLRDFSINRIIPAGNFATVARYKIHLIFDRGCTGSSDNLFGGEGFPPLDCVYNNTNFIGCYSGSSTTPDTFFNAGGKVYFASGVKLSVELTRGIRVDISISSSKIITNNAYCESFNDQTLVVDRIVNDWYIRNYYDIAQYYTYDIVFSVNIEGFEYVGIPTVIAYFFLGDPDISDGFETLNSTLLYTISSGNIVYSAYNTTIKSLQLPEGQNVYWDTHIQQSRFNEHNLIYDQRLFVDGSKVIAMFPNIAHPDINLVCTRAQQHCVGPLQQYADYNSCVTFMNTIPLLTGLYAQSVASNSVGCRQFHSELLAAPGGAAIHCNHVGPFNALISMGSAGLAVTPCVDATGPFNPLPTPTTTSRNVQRHDEDTAYKYACNPNNDICKYKILGRQSENLLWPQVALSQMHEALIPAAGNLLQTCIDTGRC